MDARTIRVAFLIAAAIGSMGASQRSANFIVSAPSPEMAAQISQAAESYRRELAVQWLGAAMPNWSAPCPIEAHVAPQLGAGGATSFLFEHGEVYGWQMSIQGSLERVLDSVLPHEVTHTVFATHFRRPLPRWADEGACTTVEHASERTKQQMMLVDFLRTNRGIPFSRMFAMKDYPHDVMPLYSQGYSLARYLIAQGGRRKFLDFLADGMQDENWTRAIQQHYTYQNLAMLQGTWLEWVRQGSPNLEAVASALPRPAAEEPSIYRGQSPDSPHPVAGTKLAPTGQALASASPAPAVGGDRPPLAKLVERDRPLRVDEGWRAPRRETLPSDAAISATSPAAYGTADSQAVGTARPPLATSPQSAPASGAAASGAANSGAADASSYQATRPQPVQQSRQIILEWSRNGGQPLTQPTASAPPTDPLSVGDRRAADGATWR